MADEPTPPPTDAGLTSNGTPPIPQKNSKGKVTYNKDGTPRKQLDPDALNKLAEARKLASKYHTNKKAPQPPAEPPPPDPPPPIPESDEEEEEAEVKVVKKATKGKKKKQPVIIVEQSESDEEEFQDKDNVIFVKRATRKPKPAPTPAPSPAPPPQPQPVAPQPPKLTREQMQAKVAYDAMFSGQFLSVNRRR
jgi:hypothetical protein